MTSALRLFALIALCATLASCGKTAKTEQPHDTLRMEFSRLLHIEQRDGYTLVTMTDPWADNAILHQYALVPQEAEEPADLPDETTVIRVPLRRMCVSTAVHTSLFKQLNALGNVGSVCDANYIMDSTLLRQIASGKIRNAGSSMNPNTERIVQLNTDAILMSPFKGTSYGVIEKIGIPIVECADYMETSALGRAEWIKFYGMLVGKGQEAEALFNEIRDRYLSLKHLTDSVKQRPKLLVDMMNARTWYLPGGNSIYGELFADAGADYSIGDKTLSGTQSLSLEKVMATALDADVWIIKYGQSNDLTYSSLNRESSAYGKFRAFKTHNVYGCNTTKVPFYDEAPFRPDLLIADMIKIFHPQLLPNHKLKFYSPLR
jgi:iron complex transport system substrate-binding protein